MLVALLPLALAAEPWRGTINQAFSSGAPHRLAGPFPDAQARLAARFGGVVDADLDALPAGQLSILYGDAGSHAALARVLAWHGIALDEHGLTVGGRRLTVEQPFLVAALPTPDRPEEPVVVYTAVDPTWQPRLNEVFHGPTPLLIGSTAGGRLQTFYAGPYTLVDGRVGGLPSGRATLTREEALADLQALQEHLFRGYAALEELGEEVGGWQAWVEAHEARLAAKEAWTWEETWDLLLDFLGPVNDAHFSVEGQVVTEDGRIVTRQARLVDTLRPWFVEGRFSEGGPAAAMPEVPGPADVQPGVAYRFPTRLADGRPAWLVGAFYAGEPPGPLQVGDRDLPLHAARGARRDPPYGWVLKGGDVPVLAVGTAREQALRGLADTGPLLRERDRVVLDARGNGGGSDAPMREWARALHGGPYRWAGGRDLEVGEGPREARTWTWEGGARRGLGRRFRGELYVVIDGGVASGGETLVQLAAQVPGATLVGAPTAGCSRFGNVVDQAPLPHTGVTMRFGHTEFRWTEVRPVAEGRGIFPDVWLDEADPTGFVVGWR